MRRSTEEGKGRPPPAPPGSAARGGRGRGGQDQPREPVPGESRQTNTFFSPPSLLSSPGCPLTSEDGGGYLRRTRRSTVSRSNRCWGHGAGTRIVAANLTACTNAFSMHFQFEAVQSFSFKISEGMNNSTAPSSHLLWPLAPPEQTDRPRPRKSPQIRDPAFLQNVHRISEKKNKI